MQKILDFHVGELDDRGRWQGTSDRFVRPNQRLITAIVRKFIGEGVNHENYKRINLALDPDVPASPQSSESTFSSAWLEISYGVDPEQYNALPAKERERELAEIIFESALSIYSDQCIEATKIRAIRDEFQRYYGTQRATFPCRQHKTKRYQVTISYTINWGESPPFFVAHVDYESIGKNPVKKQHSFALRGTENDLFALAGRISITGGDIVLTPRSNAMSMLKRKRYDIPMKVSIDEMSES